jgi:hypothetical protein
MKRLIYRIIFRIRKLFNPNTIYIWQKGDNEAAEKLKRKYFPDRYLN